MKILSMQVEGVMQSWSDSGDWNVRSTQKFPTLSAIVGMAGAAMGIERGDHE